MDLPYESFSRWIRLCHFLSQKRQELIAQSDFHVSHRHSTLLGAREHVCKIQNFHDGFNALCSLNLLLPERIRYFLKALGF